MGLSRSPGRPWGPRELRLHLALLSAEPRAQLVGCTRRGSGERGLTRGLSPGPDEDEDTPAKVSPGRPAPGGGGPGSSGPEPLPASPRPQEDPYLWNEFADGKLLYRNSRLLRAVRAGEDRLVREFWRLLAICHTVMAQERDSACADPSPPGARALRRSLALGATRPEAQHPPPPLGSPQQPAPAPHVPPGSARPPAVTGPLGMSGRAPAPPCASLPQTGWCTRQRPPTRRRWSPRPGILATCSWPARRTASR